MKNCNVEPPGVYTYGLPVESQVICGLPKGHSGWHVGALPDGDGRDPGFISWPNRRDQPRFINWAVVLFIWSASFVLLLGDAISLRLFVISLVVAVLSSILAEWINRRFVSRVFARMRAWHDG